MTQQSREEQLIELLAKKLYDAIGGGFNTNTRMANARSLAIELISEVRRFTT